MIIHIVILLLYQIVNNQRAFKKLVTKLHRYKHFIVENFKNLISKDVVSKNYLKGIIKTLVHNHI